jgi:hypothetical protein
MTSTLYHPTNLEANATDASATELDALYNVTAGTAAASKALVLNADADITTGIRDLLAVRNVTATGAVQGATVIATTSVTAPLFVGLATVVNQTGDTAISIVAGRKFVFITKSSAATPTLTAPTNGTHDGAELWVISTTGYAHTVTCGSNKINGGSMVATFGASAGNYIHLVAYATIWYVAGSTGITLS